MARLLAHAGMTSKKETQVAGQNRNSNKI